MPRTVLIVDDSAAELKMLTGFLEKEYRVITAGSGLEMISVLRDRAKIVSAIVLDLVMPDMDGFETLRRLRENAIYRQIPVIAATALTDEDSQVRAMSLGANGYVHKPINKALLLYTLDNVISLREKSALVNTFRRDSLTGLLNRASFFEAAEGMIKRREPGYYILSSFDIENFKVINDQYGAGMGDEVLKHVAGCLGRCAASLGGVCCRYSADKFGMLYPAQFRDSQAISTLHARASVSEQTGRRTKFRVGRYLVDDLSVPISAMYDRATLAEESIRGRYDVSVADYTDSMRERLLNEQRIVNDMNRALKHGEFEPWLQPQYNHATGALIGAEALVRWKKDGAYVPPAEFVPVFERNGFIYEMDQYIWEQVCVLLRRWLDGGLDPLPVSVNISRRDIFHKNFIETLTGIVGKYRIPYELLRLEVTESAFAESSGQIIARVGELIELGFVVEIDDFGSGYSSLNTLKDVPASILKLDMRFFENTKNQQRGGNIVESVVRMSKWLGMAVIAEGVEDREQADYLKSIGCYYIQGYYYARPMPVAEYEKLLASSKKEPELTRLKTLETLDNSEFWNPKSMETLIFNSYVGGACIFEYYNGHSELLRANEQYTRELGGLIAPGAELKDSSIVRFLDSENKERFRAAAHRAIERQKEAACEMRLADGGHVEYVRATVRLIAHAAERYLFYCVILNVTEQREAERKQLESAERLRIIMSNINGGVSAIQIEDDGSSRFIFCNERYYELYGYTRAQAEAAGLDVMTTILPEDFQRVLERVKKLKADRIPAIIDYRVTKRDGSLAYLRANASLMFMEGYGDVITSVVTDITATRQLEEQLSAIVDNIYGAVTATVIRDGKPQFIVVNEQFFKMLGFASRQEFEAGGNDKYVCLHPDDRERIIKQFESSDGGRSQYSMEYRVIRRDGELRYILNNIRVIKLFGVEEPVQLSVANDITDLRRAQQRESEAADKLSAVLNHAGDGITATALGGERPEYLFVNDRYFELVGCTREEYRRRTEKDMLAMIHPEDREELRRRVEELYRDSGAATLEYRVIRGDGRTIWVRSAVTITNLAGVDAPVQIAMFSDITAEREAMEQLRFLSSAAHDILSQSDSGAAVDRLLERLMGYFAGDRAYVIELDYDRRVSNNTYEICAPGVEGEKELLRDIPFHVSEYWLDTLKNDGFVVVPDVEKLDGGESELRELLLKQSIRSIIIAPLWRDGVLVGYVGIDNPRRAMEQLERLKALGDYIAVLLTRRDLSAKIDSDREMMDALMHDTPGGFVRMRMNAAGSFVPIYANEGFTKMVGMSHEQLRALYAGNVLAGVHPEDRDMVRAAAARLLERGEAESARFRVLGGGGDYIWVTLYGRVTRTGAGDTYLNIYYTDAARQMSGEQQQKNLLDNLPCGAALYEYDGKSLSVVHINKSYWDLVRREPSDYSETSVLDMIHPDDRAIVRQEIEAAIRQGRNAEVSIRILCGGGAYRPFHIDAKLAPGQNGKYLFYAAYTPVSDETMSIQEMIPIALSTVMSASEGMSYVVGRDLHYICGSPSVADMAGCENPRGLIGRTAADLFPRPFAERFMADDAAVIASGRAMVDITESVPAPDGGTRLASTSKYPIMDAAGDVIGVYCVSRDITAQRARESQLELLTGSIPGGIASYAITDGGIRMLYFNDGFFAFSGCTREEYAGLVKDDPLTFVFEEDRPQIQAMIKGFSAHKTDGHVNGCTFRCRTKDGGYRWMSMRTALSKQGEDKFVVNVVQLDITEQQEEKERLRVSEELNRIAIEHSGNIITRFDVQARTLTLPDSFNPIFVLPHVLENMPGEQIDLGRVSPDTADIYRELFESIVRGQATGSATYKQNSTKGWRWLEAQFTTVFSNTGRPVSAVISFADITERLEKEVVYNKWQQSLEERPEESYTLFRCNLSKGASFDSREGRLLDVDFDGAESSFDGRTAEYVTQCVYEEDREKYLAFLNPDTLLAEYYREHRSHVLEYRERTAGGGTRWLRLTVDLVEYPTSRDVEVYLMYEDIDEQKRAELLTLARSETDPLTGILNRSAFIDRTEQALAASRPGDNHALLMLDVDNFKHVNDTLGHGAGDQVLRDLTGSIGAMLRRDDMLGRLGGDEFFVFLRNIPDADAAATKARQICALRISVEGSDEIVTASIGIAVIPRDGADFDTLYKKADAALYRQKEHGKNGFRFVE